MRLEVLGCPVSCECLGLAGAWTGGWGNLGWAGRWTAQGPACLPSLQLSTATTHRARVVTTDDLRPRHHSYKDMRQVRCLS